MSHSNLAASSTADPVLPDWLIQVCKQCRTAPDGVGLRPPAYFRSSVWGNFTFRACPLDTNLSSKNGQVALLIERQIPVELMMVQSSDMRLLTAKEREACILILQGYSRINVARRMNVKSSTVIDYARNIYGKLGVGNRQELLEKFNVSNPNRRSKILLEETDRFL